jgi:hypothetical protein
MFVRHFRRLELKKKIPRLEKNRFPPMNKGKIGNRTPEILKAERQ